jgi:hypothetical protein
MADQNNINKTKTLQDVANYTFTKGMNQDASPEAQPKDTYRAALNMVKESSEGDENFLTTEYSNTFRIKLPGKVLHSNLIKQLDKVVVFLHTNEIGLYDPNANTYTKLYASPDLNFSIYLESVSFTKTECEDIVLIFWDGVNRVRNINVSRFLKEGPGDGPVEELDLFKTAETCIKLSNVSFIENAAYNVDAGMYRPFIQYEDLDGNTTNYYIINENIPLIEDFISGTYQYIDGNAPKKLNKSIVLEFDNIDTKYPFINIGFIKTVGGVPTAFIFKKTQPVSSSLKVTYEGDTTFDTGIDIAEVLTKRAFYVTAKHGLIYNDKLLLAGVKGIKQIDYQPIANNISVKYVTGRINLSRTKGYKNPEHIIHHKSWMRDENYMLGIVIEFEDMSESPAFPLINKKYPDFPDFTGPTGDRPITDDTKLCCTDTREYWKEVNTAKRTMYNAFAGDLSITDFCSGTFDNNNNNVRSEGYLGYFESEERYPIIPRCGVQGGSLDPDDYMYPTEVIDGKLFGKRITLFKMPDSTIEPFHNNLVDNYAIEDNKNRFDSKYDSLEIYPLGLKLENVVMPSLEETGGVRATGYRIVYVRRDTFNKSVQDKGWFVEMFKNNFNGQDYIYPKHNVNAAAKWDYFSNLRDKTIESSSPIFDFVKNCGYGKHYDKGIMFYGGNTLSYQQGLNVNHVKIEQQYNSIGYYIDSIDEVNTTKGGSLGDPVIDPSTFKDKDGRLRSSAVQIYNLYDYGYVQNNDGSIDRTGGYKNRSLHYDFKNICTDNYSYVNDNVILNKILNTEFSLVNFYRESGLYLDYQLKSDLSFHNSLGFFNSDTSSKKCDMTSGGGSAPFNFTIVNQYEIDTSNTIILKLQTPGVFNVNDIYFIYNPGLFSTILPGDSFQVTSVGMISGFPPTQNVTLTKINSGSMTGIGNSYTNLILQKIPNFAAEQTFTVTSPSLVTYNNNYPIGTTIIVSNSTNTSVVANSNTFIVTNSTTLTLTGGPPLTIGTSDVFVTASAPTTPTGVTYFGNYIDNATVPNILDRCNHGYIYYGSIKNNLPSQYGSIDDMFFIDTGLKGCAGQETLIGFYGDSYINTFSFVRTGVTGMLEDSYIDDNSTTWMDRGDGVYTIQNIIGRSPTGDLLLNLYLAQKANVTLLNTVIESDVNLDLRYEGPTFNEVYYPKLSNGKYYLYSNRKNEYAEDCYLNTYFYELICRNDQDNCTSTNYDEVEYNDAYKNFHNNKINLNSDYNELNGMRYNLIKPINRTYKTCDCDTEFDNRIAVSSSDNQSVGRLNYSKFLKNNFITLPHKEGKITNLLKESQVLYAHTTDNIWKLLTLESKLQANNSLVYLGTNDLLSAQQLELFASNEGYMGLQDKRFSFQNNTGYFFVDLKNQSLNLMSGGKLDAISTYGMNSFFKDVFNKYFNSYSLNKPLSEIQIYFGYDYRHKRLLLTDIENDYTLSYYPEDKAFYSFHSYKPMAYIQNRDTFFTQSQNYDLYLHEDNFNSYRNFYGVNYPSMVDAVFTYHPLIYTTLQNIGIKMDAYKNVNDQLILIDEPPTSVSVWTSRQHSGEIMLKKTVDADYMHNIVSSTEPYTFINGTIYCNNLSNYVLDSSINFLQGGIFKYPTSNVSFAKDWTQIDRLENNFFNYRINIDNKDLENLKFILKFTLLNYNISMR